jgi:hypothetical protein
MKYAGMGFISRVTGTEKKCPPQTFVEIPVRKKLSRGRGQGAKTRREIPYCHLLASCVVTREARRYVSLILSPFSLTSGMLSHR